MRRAECYLAQKCRNAVRWDTKEGHDTRCADHSTYHKTVTHDKNVHTMPAASELATLASRDK